MSAAEDRWERRYQAHEAEGLERPLPPRWLDPWLPRLRELPGRGSAAGGSAAPLLRLTPGRRTAKLLADPRLWSYLTRVDASCRRFRDALSIEAGEDVVVEAAAVEDDLTAPIAGPAMSEAAVLGWLLLLASPREARPWLHPRPDDDLRRARMRMRILFDQRGLLRKRMGITFRLLRALRSLRLDSSTAARACVTLPYAQALRSSSKNPRRLARVPVCSDEKACFRAPPC